MIILQVLGAAFVIMLASLSGAIFMSGRISRWLIPRLPYLVTFSAGVFLAIVYGLISEIMDHGAPWLSILGWVALGVVGVEILSRIIPKAHHHHGVDMHDHEHDRLDARRMMLGDAMHNMADGLILVPAFLVDIRIGIVTTIGIFAHELVQEISEYFVLRQAGYTLRQALGYNFLVSSTILVGVLLSLTVASAPILELPLLGFSAGGFIYIIMRDLLPHTILMGRRQRSMREHIVAGCIGVVCMLLLTHIIPHEPVEAHTLTVQMEDSGV